MDAPARDATAHNATGTILQPPPRRLWRPMPIPALILYALLAFFWFGSRGSWTARYLGEGNDPVQFMWFLKWWPFAIGKGIDPFWTRYVWYPHGFDLVWATSVPMLALLAAPLTAAKGAVFSFNVISVLSPALSAWTGYLLARDVTRDDIASLFAGFFFGFSAYELGQLLGHLNLDAIFLIPLIVLAVLRRFRGALSRRRFVALATLGLFVELGISMEIVASFCTLGAIVWAVFWFCGPREDRQRLWRLAIDIVIAGCCLAILSLPYAVYLVLGASTAPDTINPTTIFSANLLNYALPTWPERFGYGLAHPISAHFSGNPSEQGAYLGLPLIAILLASAWQFRKNRRIRALLVSILALVLASLGPVLHVTGRPTGIPLPWALAQHLPLIRSALPTRFTMFIALAAGLAAALWVAAGSGAGRVARIAAAFVACLLLIPNPLAYAWHKVPVAPMLTKPAIAKLLGPKPNLVVLPFAYAGPGMGWQLGANMAFTQSGGYVGFFPRHAGRWIAVHDLIVGKPSADFANGMTAFCATHRVTAILLTPGTPPSLAHAVLALGWPATRLPDMTPDVTIVRVPPADTLDYYAVTGNYWPSGGPRSWIGRAAAIHTGLRPLTVKISGQDRPAPLPPVRLTVTIGDASQIYSVNDATRIEFTVPPSSTATLRAARVFRPSDVIDNGDKRHLSVEISVSPGKTTPPPAAG